MTAAATKTKPEHRVQPVSGVIPTPEQESKMSTMVPEALTTVESSTSATVDHERPRRMRVHRVSRHVLANVTVYVALCGDVWSKEHTVWEKDASGERGRRRGEPAMCPACEAANILRSTK